MLRAGTILLCAALLLAACSDSDDGGDSTGEDAAGTTEADSTTTTNPVSVVGDSTTTTASTSTTTTTAATSSTTSTSERIQPTSSTAARPGTANLTTDDRISTVGFGEVFVGMTLATAEEEAGTTFTPDGPGTNACRYYIPADGPSGIRFMISFGRVAVVEVTNPEVRTRSGLGIGTARDDLLAGIGDNLEERENPFDPARQDQVFVPTDENDANQRIVFTMATSGSPVESYRSGQLPEVLYGPACERP